MTSIVFKEFLPDQPELGNPGLLNARNVIPADDGSYMPYTPLSVGAAAAFANDVNSAFPYAQTSGGTAGGYNIYGLIAGTAHDLLRLSANSATFNSLRPATYGGSSTVGSATNFWRFAQIDNIILATNRIDAIQQYTIGAASFTMLSADAPLAQQIAIVGRFAVAGNISGANGFHSIQWSGIDDIDSWPTPNSATAIAQQSGKQIMSAAAGTVTGITNGDQFSVIFQRAGISRMTYVGPPVVFQFDPLDQGRGCFYPNSLVQVGQVTYFASGLGFFMTDGTSVVPIGEGQTDKFFADLVAGAEPSTAVYGAVDYETKRIMWSVKGTTILHYHYGAKRWSYSSENARVLISGIQRS